MCSNVAPANLSILLMVFAHSSVHWSMAQKYLAITFLRPFRALRGDCNSFAIINNSIHGHRPPTAHCTMCTYIQRVTQANIVAFLPSTNRNDDDCDALNVEINARWKLWAAQHARQFDFCLASRWWASGACCCALSGHDKAALAFMSGTNAKSNCWAAQSFQSVAVRSIEKEKKCAYVVGLQFSNRGQYNECIDQESTPPPMNLIRTINTMMITMIMISHDTTTWQWGVRCSMLVRYCVIVRNSLRFVAYATTRNLQLLIWMKWHGLIMNLWFIRGACIVNAPVSGFSGINWWNSVGEIISNAEQICFRPAVLASN